MSTPDPFRDALMRACVSGVQQMTTTADALAPTPRPTEIRTSPARPHSFVVRTPDGEFYHVKITKSSWRDHDNG